MIEDALLYGEFECVENFKNVFIGHTTTLGLDNQTNKVVLVANKIYMMDTGAAYEGVRLSIMNIKTKQIFQD